MHLYGFVAKDKEIKEIPKLFFADCLLDSKGEDGAIHVLGLGTVEIGCYGACTRQTRVHSYLRIL